MLGKSDRVLLAAGVLLSSLAVAAPPTFDSPSPNSGRGTSDRANEMADKGMYKAVEYENADKKGPALVVIPGEIKSNNSSFMQRFGANNIADFVELELSKANFKVLERANLGSLQKEFQLAYTLGDPEQARKYLQRGKLKTTNWVVKFDVLKAEPVAAAEKGFDGGAIGGLISSLAGNKYINAAGRAAGSVKSDESTNVWIIGMRYKIMDANTTEQVATGYNELKMELGAKASSVLGVKGSEKGGLTLDGMVQRLVQLNVYEIDKNYK